MLHKYDMTCFRTSTCCRFSRERSERPGRSLRSRLTGMDLALNLKIQYQLAPISRGASVAILQFGRFRADLVHRGNAAGDEHVAADHRAFPDDGVTAKDGRPGIDGDVVLDRRVP